MFPRFCGVSLLDSGVLEWCCRWWILLFDRSTHPEGGVASLLVVKTSRYPKTALDRFDPGTPPSPVQRFGLHANSERFGDETVKGKSPT